MRFIHNIAEFFFPVLEGEPSTGTAIIKEEDIQIPDENIEAVYGIVKDHFETEEKRREKVESKSSLFIGTTSVVSSVILAVAAVAIKGDDLNKFPFLIFLVLFILTVYICRTLWFSIQAMERKPYHQLSPRDFIQPGSKNDLYRKLILKTIENTQKNTVLTNQKVDSMVMAQEYFKRALIVVGVCMIVLFLNFSSQLDFEVHPIFFPSFLRAFPVSYFAISISVLLNVVLLIALILISRKKKKAVELEIEEEDPFEFN